MVDGYERPCGGPATPPQGTDERPSYEPAASDVPAYPLWLDELSIYAEGTIGDAGVASVSDTAAAVGVSRVEVVCPDNREDEDAEMLRGARVYIERPEQGLPEGPVLNRLFQAAYTRAIRDCEMGKTHRGLPWTGIGFIELYRTSDGGASPKLLIYARENIGGFGTWKVVSTPEAEQQRIDAQIAEQRAATAAASARAAQQAQERAIREEEGRKFTAAFWGWVRLIGLAVLLLWLYAKREAILSWYYSLTPHPARDMVEHRIGGGGPIDGELFAEIMQVVPGGRIEQRVRVEQARRLAAMAREAAEARLRELERLKARALQEAEYLRAQAELHSAVEGHEMAMARLDAVREWRKRHVG